MINKGEIRINAIPLTELKGKDNFLQSGFWGEFKSKHGWIPFALEYEVLGKKYPLLVLVRKLGKIIPISYIPHAPVIPEGEDIEQFLAILSWELQGELPLGNLFIRYDLPFGTTGENIFPTPLSSPLKKAILDIQPPDTTILDITNDKDDLLAAMHKKTRYNIKLAEKKGVIITEENIDQLDKWYDLYRTTAQRDKIALHPKSYYLKLLQLAEEWEGKAPVFKIYFAKHEEELLAGIIVAQFGECATYLYGASSNQKRNLMPAYLLQWRAILDAKEAGMKSYDFFGIPPENNPDHPMHGLYRFKTGFGGEILHRYGCWDYPASKVYYYLYVVAERIRKWYYKSFKKR